MELASPFTGQSLLTSSNKQYFDRRNRLGVGLLWYTHALSLFTVALAAPADFFHLLLEAIPLPTQRKLTICRYLCTYTRLPVKWKESQVLLWLHRMATAEVREGHFWAGCAGVWPSCLTPFQLFISPIDLCLFGATFAGLISYLEKSARVFLVVSGRVGLTTALDSHSHRESPTELYHMNRNFRDFRSLSLLYLWVDYRTPFSKRILKFFACGAINFPNSTNYFYLC